MKSISKELKITEEMKKYEEETGKHAIWRGEITESFKKWKKGEKIYEKDKERIAILVSENTKTKWLNFAKNNNYSTISKLIREGVDFYIDLKSKNPFIETISDLSHSLKEPLTSIKGFSQILIEKYKDELSGDVLSRLREILNKSIILENKISTLLESKKPKASQYDILIIEDDTSTITVLADFFEIKGYICKGVVSGSKGLDELKLNTPKLILLDVILPDMTGYEICRMIKSNKNINQIPIYFITAVPGTEVSKNILGTRADGYLLKPFNFPDFEVLDKYL